MVRAINPGKKITTSVSLDPEVLSIIDRERGDMPRSTWVNDLILETFEN